MSVIESTTAASQQPWTRGRPSLSSVSLAERLGVGLFAVLILAAITAPLIASNPTVSVGQPFASPSMHHLLGTDDIGEDCAPASWQP